MGGRQAFSLTETRLNQWNGARMAVFLRYVLTAASTRVSPSFATAVGEDIAEA